MPPAFNVSQGVQAVVLHFLAKRADIDADAATLE
jgi:hypothetical protein